MKVFLTSIFAWNSIHTLTILSLYLALYVMRSRGISRKSNMWHCQFSIWLKCSFRKAHFAENPTWISPVVLMLWAIEGFSEQWKTIEIHFFFWIYLLINAANFRLIPLDRNTHVVATCHKDSTSAVLFLTSAVLFLKIYIQVPNLSWSNTTWSLHPSRMVIQKLHLWFQV